MTRHIVDPLVVVLVLVEDDVRLGASSLCTYHEVLVERGCPVLPSVR